MSISNISSLAISAIAAVVLTAGVANASSYGTHSHSMVRSSVEDLSVNKNALPAKQFFERQQRDGN
ncbi:MAG: hypothetical protein P8Y67_07585 [Alphaproteobacteria bacterium]